MSEMTWTPGPWKQNYGDGVTGPRAAPSAYWGETDIVYIPVRHGEDVVCWLATSRGTEDNLLPDARLIASAPELYEALEGVLKLLDEGQLIRDTSNDANPDWAMRQIPFVTALSKIQTALAKARGEAA